MRTLEVKLSCMMPPTYVMLCLESCGVGILSTKALLRFFQSSTWVDADVLSDLLVLVTFAGHRILNALSLVWLSSGQCLVSFIPARPLMYDLVVTQDLILLLDNMHKYHATKTHGLCLRSQCSVW